MAAKFRQRRPLPPPSPSRYAVSWDVPNSRPLRIVVGVCQAHELMRQIVLALAECPEACIQVRRA